MNFNASLVAASTLSKRQKELLSIFRQPIERGYIFPVRPETYPNEVNPMFKPEEFEALRGMGLIKEHFGRYPQWLGVKIWELTEHGFWAFDARDKKKL